MPQTSTTATAPQLLKPAPSGDDTPTICASIVAGILTNVLHEGVGHGLTALLTGANTGVLTHNTFFHNYCEPSWSSATR